MTTTTPANFFNLHTSGVGYLNRVRWVTTSSNGRKAQPFLACSIAALRGNSDDSQYTYFDLRVSGEEAMRLVEKAMEDVKANRKVFVSFKIGDIYPHMYERQGKTGAKETAVLIKGRLLLISSISIDGECVYRREEQDQSPALMSESDSDGSVPQQPEIVAPRQPVHAPHAKANVVKQNPAACERRAPNPLANRPAYKAGYATGRATRQGLAAMAA